MTLSKARTTRPRFWGSMILTPCPYDPIKGSDYTATLLGASLRASRVVINTDVSGVMTASQFTHHNIAPLSQNALKIAI